ncbi:hypothetical protein M2G69_04295 [Vibrio vulnificus]|nr:hypothetical protein [Vibrio vulnificus]
MNNKLKTTIVAAALSLMGCSTIQTHQLDNSKELVITKHVHGVTLDAAYDRHSGEFEAWVGREYYVGNHPDLMDVYNDALEELSQPAPCSTRNVAYSSDISYIGWSMFEERRMLNCKSRKVNLGYYQAGRSPSVYITGSTTSLSGGSVVSSPTAGYSKGTKGHLYETWVNVEDLPSLVEAIEEMEQTNIK